jgi:putative ABC transport system permease protein
MAVSLPQSRYPTDERAPQFYEAAEREIQAVPGVREVSFGGSLPLDGWDLGQGFEVVGDPPAARANLPAAHYQIVGPRYFATLGIPLVAGRAFGEADTATAPPVCIVSEAFVRRYARRRDPLRLRVRVNAMSMAGPTPVVRQVVGVAHQIREMPADDSDPVQIYVPLAQNPWYWATLSVQTAVEPAGAIDGIKAAIARIDKAEAVTNVRTLGEVQAEATARPRFRARLVSLFALTALALAAVGIGGVLAFTVSQRSRELGIRMALGARATDIQRLVLADGLRMTAIGVAAGLASAAGLGRLLTPLLYRVTPLDPVTFVAAPLILAVTALTAAALPALRASRIDAAGAIREE